MPREAPVTSAVLPSVLITPWYLLPPARCVARLCPSAAACPAAAGGAIRPCARSKSPEKVPIQSGFWVICRLRRHSSVRRRALFQASHDAPRRRSSAASRPAVAGAATVRQGARTRAKACVAHFHGTAFHETE